MEQLIAHLVGDYVLQSQWMANNKDRENLPCLLHCLLYTACFLALTGSWKALLVIGVTHFLIDRFRLVRYLIWAKNWLTPLGYYPWSACQSTGYLDVEQDPIGLKEPWDQRPIWLRVWLLIITDNTLHLALNYAALKYL
jgi:hypothetical protein